MERAPASTASIARPDFSERIFHATAFTAKPLSQVETTIGFWLTLLLLPRNDLPIESIGKLKNDHCKNFLLDCISLVTIKMKEIKL
jgi:hypothetical protein